MATVGAFEAKTHFAQLLQRVEPGEESVITRRGKEVARLVPTATKPDAQATMAVFQRLRERATQAGLDKFDWEEWRAYRDQDRP
jgi:prevent-host-death family protein